MLSDGTLASIPVVPGVELMGLTCCSQQFAFTHLTLGSEPSSGKTRNLRAVLGERLTGAVSQRCGPGTAGKSALRRVSYRRPCFRYLWRDSVNRFSEPEDTDVLPRVR